MATKKLSITDLITFASHSSKSWNPITIHDRMTTFLEPRDYAEYLQLAERPPLHLLRIFSSDEMQAAIVEKTDVINRQVSLFDSH